MFRKVLAWAVETIHNLFCDDTPPARANSSTSPRLTLKQLEKREVPAVYTWEPSVQNPPTDTKWTTVANWKKDGAAASVPPGENDTVKLPPKTTTTRADVPKVRDILPLNANDKSVDLNLIDDLIVTNTISVDSFTLSKDGTPIRSLTVDSGGAVTIGQNFSLYGAVFQIGSPAAQNVTANIKFGVNSVWSNARIQNWGTMTFTGDAVWRNGGSSSSLFNNLGATMNVQCAGFDTFGTFVNVGTLKLNNPTDTILFGPELDNLGLVQVFPGTVDFAVYNDSGVFSHGDFQLRGGTVKGSANANHPIRIADGRITGFGTINGHLALGQAGEENGPPQGGYSQPKLIPGIDDNNPATQDIGEITVQKSLTIHSPLARVDLDVKNLTTQDKVVVTDGATVRGSINVTVAPGYQPGTGQDFTLISASAITGVFDVITIAPPVSWFDAVNNQWVHWHVYKNNNGDKYVLQVVPV